MPPEEKQTAENGAAENSAAKNNAGKINTAGLSLDELIAVCEELASLDRAGLPLVPALRRSSRDVSRRIDRVRAQLADQLAQGCRLSEVAGAMVANMTRSGSALQTALEAGLRSARPAAALETYVRAARQLADTRAMIARASVYPIFVMLLACGVFWMVTQLVAPQLAVTYTDLGLAMPWVIWAVAQHGTAITLVGLGFVLLMFIWMVLWWRTGTAMGTPGRRLIAPLGIVPGWRGFVGAASRTCAVRLFGVMLESGVPLDECLEKSAELSSSRHDRQWAVQTAVALRGGAPPAKSLADGPFLPPLVVWWLLGGEPPKEIGRRIRQFSDEEFARLAHRARLLQSLGPALATIAVGTTAGACYSLSMFAPLYSLLEAIAMPQ